MAASSLRKGHHIRRHACILRSSFYPEPISLLSNAGSPQMYSRCISTDSKNKRDPGPTSSYSDYISPKHIFATEDTQTSNSIAYINKLLTFNPYATAFGFLGIRNLSFFAISGVIGFAFPWLAVPELGLGYVASKFTGKFRQPINLFLAAYLSNRFPILSKINASAIMGVLPMPTVHAAGHDDQNSTVTGDRGRPTQGQEGGTSLENMMLKGINTMSAQIDKYGLSFYLSAKLSQLVVIAGASALIKMGIDVDSLLASMDIAEEMKQGASAMGTALVINILFIPTHFQLLIKGLTTLRKYGIGNVFQRQ